MSRKHDRRREPGRRASPLAPRRRLLIVCEGGKTELQYLGGFRRACGVPSGLVEIVPHGGGSPITIVTHAIELRDAAALKADHDGDPTVAYDAAWCVYDVDDHDANARRSAAELAAKHGVSMAVSNPSFELWLYLHFADSPGMQTRRWLHDRISKQVGKYGKSVAYDRHFAAGYPQAADRAGRLDALAASDGEPGRNPTTGVYRLTRELERASRA